MDLENYNLEEWINDIVLSYALHEERYPQYILWYSYLAFCMA